MNEYFYVYYITRTIKHPGVLKYYLYTYDKYHIDIWQNYSPLKTQYCKVTDMENKNLRISYFFPKKDL